MTEVTRASGVIVSVTGPAELTRVAPPPRRGAKFAKRAAAGAPGDGGLALDALRGQDFELVDSIPLQFPPAARPKKRGAAAPSSAVTLDVPLAPEEQAVILLEDEGEFRWIVDGKALPSAAPKRGGKAGAAKRQIRFSIELKAAPPPPVIAVKRGGVKRNWLVDKLVGKVTAYVFRFAVKLAGKKLVEFRERKVEQGLVAISAPDSQQWKLLGDAAALPFALPADRPARVLLLVHGTFSSTVGSFGALGIEPHGRDFLGRAIANYDAVLGFDHRTLSVDPLKNAKDLLARLRRVNWAQPPQIEMIAFSRGGLVARALVEDLLPGSQWGATIGRVVFVGCTNGGTQLAEPDNWHRFADHYTNLALGATRALSLIPGAQGWTTIAGQVIRGVGALVKALASGVVTDKVAPGLAAMEPDGEFVTSINKAQTGHPAAADAQYFAVMSDFEPGKALANGSTPELSPKLLMRIADWGADELYGEANDLVVHVRSMSAIDPALGDHLNAKLDYGSNGVVYHTNYFTRDTTATQLIAWFELPGSAPTIPKRGARRSGAVGTVPTTHGPQRKSVPPAAGPRAASESKKVPALKKKAAAPQPATRSPAKKPLSPTARRRAPPPPPSKRSARRTLRSAAGTKLYAVRHAEGRFGDIQTYQRAQTAGLGKDREAGAQTVPRKGQVTKAKKAMGKKPLSPAAIRRRAAKPAPRPRSIRGRNPMTGDALVVPPAPEQAGRLPPPKRSVKKVAIDTGTAAEVPKLQAAAPPRIVFDADARRRMTRGTKAAEKAVKDTVSSKSRNVVIEKSFGAPTVTKDGVTIAKGTELFAGNGGGRKENAQVECHFRAEMDQEVIVNKQVSVDVTIARHTLEVPAGRAGETTVATVEAEKKLIVQIAERRNFRVDGERRVEIDVPEPDTEANVSFDVTGLTAGEEGELWVQVRQGPVPLVTMKLKPRIVATLSAGRVARLPVEHELAAMPPPEPPLDELLIAESFVGNDVQYRYFLNLPSLKIRKHFESPVIKGRDSYIVKILNRIGEAWAGTGHAEVAAFETDLKAIGAMIFTELMPREMQELLWEQRDRITSVQVFSMEPFIPWELVYLKDPRAEVISYDSKFLGELGLLRWLYDGYPPTQITLGNGRARYIIPTYTRDMVLPEAAEEEKMLKKLFKATRVSARALDVQKLMRTPGTFDLLHFGGHAEAAGAEQADARLLLDQSDNGTTENALLATTVAQTAQLNANGRRPIVVLNACESARISRSFASMGGFASAFVSRGAGVFIGTHWSVGDAPARTFIEEFYKSFAVRKAGVKPLQLREAVTKARQAARDGGDATWLAYVVYGHPRAVVAKAPEHGDNSGRG